MAEEVGANRTGSAATAHVFCAWPIFCPSTQGLFVALASPLTPHNTHTHCPTPAHCRARAPTSRTAEDLDDEGLDTALQVVADVFDDPPPHSTYSEMARRIRTEMDKKMGTRGWSVVVGKSYGAYLTQKIKAYAYVSVFPGASILAKQAGRLG